jgi:hypothetical protein
MRAWHAYHIPIMVAFGLGIVESLGGARARVRVARARVCFGKSTSKVVKRLDNLKSEISITVTHLVQLFVQLISFSFNAEFDKCNT